MRILSIFSVVLLMLPTATARAGSLKEGFLAQYSPAAEKLERFYNTITIRGTLEKTRNGQTDSVERCDLYAAGDHVRVDALYLDNGAKAPDEAQLRAAVAAPKGSFVVTRDRRGSDFTLDRLVSEKRRFEQVMRSQRPYLFAPYIARGGASVLEILKSPTLAITAIDEKKESDGERIVTVSYRNDTKLNGKPWQLTGSYSFLKDRAWALRGSVRRAPDNVSEFRSHIEYEGDEDGFPLLKHVEYVQDVRSAGSFGQSFTVTEIKAGPVPLDTFKLAAFGIPDIRQEQESEFWLLSIVAGIAALGAAFVLRRFIARRQHTRH